MKESKIYIRVDGGPEIGLGHLVRCMALAHMLKDDFEINFVSKEIPDNISEDILNQGFLVKRIDSEQDIFSYLSGKEIVVVDHYGLDSAYQENIKRRGSKLICIDDLHNKLFYADLIINHAPGITPEDYKAQTYTQFALGLDYALLRPEFLKAAKQKKINKEVNTVFVCFGGSDLKNITERCLNVLLGMDKFERIIVVVGSSHQKVRQIKEIAAGNKEVDFYHSIDAKKMLELMKISDLAIVPSSGILLEALSLGLKIISGMYVENQRYVFENYNKEGVFVSAGNFSKEDILLAVNKLISQSSAPLVDIDGHSALRINKYFQRIMIEDDVVLRTAGKEDLEITFQWANNSVVRAHSFTRGEIELIDHSEWFMNKLNNSGCYYLIAQLDKKVIGSIRFDINNDEAVINFLVDPQFHRQGFGIIILKKGLENLKSRYSYLKYVIGYVMKDNIASIKAFQRLGYNIFSEDGNYKFIKELN
ncbi:UDP-2,4-diacetamido-2,4,6-trideoxy-beta-L-altropyranose hydrolase [Autumnicola musiva]|uniref:UDP-2,4-diacetamido-2,4, 6-trideoxy-beta-L-altropyranose hydrolase n=1 Tax=Autumnicola musiva TaxID=3075589 RepID=A0ABU3D7E5_9FLAO|nr:UDP-2,4-diacetamido-2,4,6-trideoxy-beta-L-altropyranose hydrolase [Zunongwangia sp. F117]MDT0677456.1 UDP-2,4-diacetamido-2,4,6-trideoxy-beta-L-altropyranose hydrolase [Zunongwangia sp. F117]